MNTFTFIAATLLSSVVSAAPAVNLKETRMLNDIAPRVDDGDIQTACTNVTTNAPGCTCATVNTRGFSRVWLNIIYTKGAATRVDMEVHTANVANAWAVMQSGPVDSLPALLMGNHDPYWDTTSVSGTVGWGVGFDVVTPDMRFCFVGTSANASDLVDIYVTRF